MAIQQIGSGGPPTPIGTSSPPAPKAQKPQQQPAEAPAKMPAPALSSDQLQQAIQAIQKAVDPVAQNLQFSIDRETGRTVIKVVDSATNQVVRQIPSEEVLQIAHSLDRLTGLLLKRKA